MKVISIKNKAFVLFAALILFLIIGTASAVNETDVTTIQDFDSNDVISEDITNDNVLKESSVKTTIKSDDTNIVKGKEFSVKLTDSNSTPIANQNVQFTLNKVVSKAKTDSNGVAKLKINLNPGTYTVKYSFSATDGYKACSNSTKIFVITTSTTKMQASNYVGYIGVENKYTLILTAGNTPLANKIVTFKFDGETFTRKTNDNGRALFRFNKPVGTYKLTIFYPGEKNIKNCSATVKITVKKGMPTSVTGISSLDFKSKKAGYFKVKVLDKRKNPVASQKVVFKFHGKRFVKKTNAKGIASVKIKLNAGTYKLRVWFKKTSVYNKSHKFFTINVGNGKLKSNGVWLFAGDMGKVNFNNLRKNGLNQIFLNFYCFHLHSKKYVESWIKKANAKGIKVHIWMQAFYGDRGWSNPATGGKINNNLINSKVKEAVKYAKIKGVAGVHIDYVRYPGTAYKHSGAVKAVNLFVKKAATAVHKVNKKLIVSAAVMPEPSGMKTYYAQDIATMGKYLDVIVPMAYKGNYHAGAKWIQYVTQTFAKQCKKAKIWTGLQAYRSDANVAKIPAKELKSDAKAASKGGAQGIIMFRYGLCNLVNFSKV